MIQSLLIANRGEIACRIIRTARRLGIRTIAVFSDADAKALHVREADEAVHIGPSPARESYLVGDKIIAAAKQTGAEAIHPGYGFLSENAEFAEAVIDAGLTWVGPKPHSIRAMGLKDAAKKLMDEAGVPTTPGYLGEDQSPDRLQREADAIGYPVLIKAVAGGGGKGMRRVNSSSEFQDMLISCKREAASSFGDDRVLIEKYILRPRHIEVQVFGDSHGNVVHLFERDCSLQRRHQKVIEEAPAPGMDEETRAAVCGAAVKAAQAVDYVGAGTIEFIADASEGLKPDRIWFMEMNTRLQVEHPVTEEITGQDLVEWQLRVASGEPLPKTQDELGIDGWAMEARLYAEDPSHEFLPSTGPLKIFDLPDEERDLLGLGSHRLETGFTQGSTVSRYYDPMIAKLIFHASDRSAAAYGLAHYCGSAMTWPVKTNSGFLTRALRHPDFLSGDVDTGFIPRNLAELLPSREVEEDVLSGAAIELLRLETGLGDHDRGASFYKPAGKPGAVWRELAGFRLNASTKISVALEHDGQRHDVALPADWREKSYRVAQARREGGLLFIESGQARFIRPYRPVGASVGGASDGSIISPMPGRVIAVDARQGDRVAKGQKLVTLEAMKMEHSLTAPFDGIVAELNAAEGEQVTEGTLLVRIEKGEG